jgi:hypothetical protein
MSEFNVQKYVLLCMRLAAECRGLAADVSTLGLRAHFFRMASVWEELAQDSHKWDNPRDRRPVTSAAKQ